MSPSRFQAAHGSRQECVQSEHDGKAVKVGTREFRERLAITRRGETLGFYIPARNRSRKAESSAMRTAAKELDRMIASLGISEDALIEDDKEIRRIAREKQRNAR